MRYVQSLPEGVCVWLVKRAHAWVLYIVEEVARHLGKFIPGLPPVPLLPTAAQP
ncbi:hypothetical protein [Streptomyces monomycini]|uniref:hypothetical protein n=1 Tax=Streptomyces monomycini TaxID=371720 RepID=UPI0012FEB68B|nr:hypothetical protein [Streptomyces monomycini]